MKNPNFTFDVLIVGAGVAGCATAIALKNLNPNLQIAIIEREALGLKKQHVGETLPPHASQQLQQLGIWDTFLSHNFIQSYGTSSAWGSAELHTNEFLYSPFGYGWNLDRKIFDQFMVNEAKKRGAFFFWNTSCTEAIKFNEYWTLNCKNNQGNQIISTKFAVDASGKKAAFSSLQGVSKIVQDQLVGIYRYYEAKNKNNGIGNGTCVETDPFGWWYSATLPNNRMVVSYMTDTDIANELQLRKKDPLDNLLSKTFYTSKRLSEALVQTEPKVVAAHSQRLSSVFGDAWLAVGDAASCYDPISSLGIYKSLLMSRFAAFAILDNLKGDTLGLKKYQHIISQDFEGYLSKKQEYYSQENRFKNESFWKRRQFNK
jgi:flavin-dependent dehydrogenase